MKTKRKSRNAARTWTMLGLLSFFLFSPAYVCGEESQQGSNKEKAIRDQEDLVAAALKKGNQELRSDALYDLAKLCAEYSELDRAEKAMRESITIEDKLNRPEQYMNRHYSLGLILARKKTDN